MFSVIGSVEMNPPSERNYIISRRNSHYICLSKRDGDVNTQKSQPVQDLPMYEDQMNKSIEALASSMKVSFKENLATFFGTIDEQIKSNLSNLHEMEVAQLKANHAEEIDQLKRNLAKLEAAYRARIYEAEREKVLAVEETKKKTWCSGCGDGIKCNMMMFCNSECKMKFA